MSDQIPLKKRGDALGEFEPGDAVPVQFGGTGANNAVDARASLGLANVAATGQYDDLLGKPTLFSGSYNDLSNKPSIPDDSNLVHKSGNETIAGNKTFSGNLFTSSMMGAQFPVTVGDIRFVQNGGMPALIARNGDYTGSAYASGGFRQSAAEFQIGVSTTPGVTTLSRWVAVGSAYFAPGQNNTLSCGISSNAWTQVYAQNTTISTSDARLKTGNRDSTEAENAAFRAILRLPGVWQWIQRVHEEGDEARLHSGPTVQAAMAIMEAHGLDPFAYACFCYDKWDAVEEQWHERPAKDAVLDDDGKVLEPAVEAGRELVQESREAGDRYSFRITELEWWCLRALATQHDELEARVAALEAKG